MAIPENVCVTSESFRRMVPGTRSYSSPQAMNLEFLIASAKQQGASDLHLEAGLPAALRVRGSLRTIGEPVAAKILSEWVRELVGEAQWHNFLERGSADLSRTIEGARCRINILRTNRGVGLAIRLLSTFQATIEKLNLH